MSKTIRTLTPLVFWLLAVSSHLADDNTSPLEGRWDALNTQGSEVMYEMEFTGKRFHAVAGEMWYKGEFVIDVESEPATIDFTIRECNCGFVDKTSQGIFRKDGDKFEVRAPEPGDPRPTEFDIDAGSTMLLVRESGDDGDRP